MAMLARPPGDSMKATKITESQFKKIVRAALYVGVSATISYVVSLIADNPDLFGPLTPAINVALVTIKQLFTPNT